jgi:adenylate cyclase
MRSQTGLPVLCWSTFSRHIGQLGLDPLLYHYKFGIALGHLSARRYETAMDWVSEALREQPQFSAGFRVKVALCGLLGRSEEGRTALARLLELQPGLTVATFAAHAATFLSAEMTDLMVTGLRKAGLPESTASSSDTASV